MKKTVKNRFLSIVLSAVLILGGAAPAYAVESTGPDDAGASVESVQLDEDGAVADDEEIVSDEETTSDEDGVLDEKGMPQRDASVTYKDGVYEGTGYGYHNGAIVVNVTISDGKISKVELVKQTGQSYWESHNVSVMFDRIVEAGNTDVDGVTRATETCDGIKEAVNNALSKAEASDEEPGNDVFASGKGTKTDPYLINSADQLKAFAKSVNDGESYSGQYVSLNNDLDISDLDWTPIGVSGSGFAGCFNGDNHVVTGLKIGTKAEPAELSEAGLFGIVAASAEIRNLSVKDAEIYNKVAGSQAIGLIAADTGRGSVVENCSAEGSIYSTGSLTDSERYSYIGGLVGANGVKSLIANSWADVDITSKSGTENSVGGIVGATQNNSLVINCAAFGSVSDYGEYGTGGIVGMSSGAVYACYTDITLHLDAMSYEDGADVPIGAIAGGTSYMAAAYNCWFNSEAKQTYYGGDEVAEPVAVGYDAINWSASDNGNCEGLKASEMKTTLADKLAAALTEEGLAAGQKWFSDQGLLDKDSTLESFFNMTESGWNAWEADGEGGSLLPTGGSASAPEEPDYFENGDGSKDSPYEIANEDQLRKFAAATQSGKLITANKYFKLTADIALNGEWTPVKNFGGYFDGDYHTVSGMYIGSADAPSALSSAGFFNILANEAEIHNLHLTGVEVYVKSEGSKIENRVYVGGLVGGTDQSSGKNVRIDNCSVTGSVLSADAVMQAYSGGIAGYLGDSNYVTNCWTDIETKAASTDYPACAGGLLAQMRGSSMVANCGALGDVTASGKSGQYNFVRAGGLTASAPYLTQNCYAAGNVTLNNTETSNPAYIGAIAGEQSGGAIIDGHYGKDTVLTVNGEKQDTVATGSRPSSWYNGIEYNKIIAEESLTDKAFADSMNYGVSEEGLAAADNYLINGGKFTSFTAADLENMRPDSWETWNLIDGKVILGEVKPDESAMTGEGTAEDPYVIKTEAQLRGFAASTYGAEATDYAGKYVALDADIALTGAWTPVHMFAGYFDGRNHTVSGMTIGTAAAPVEQNSVGFFDILANNSQVRNLKLTDVSVYAEISGSYDRVFAGGLVGGNNSYGRNVVIDNCSVSGGTVSGKSAFYSYAGGLAGLLSTYSYVTNCWTDVNVSALIDDNASMGTSIAGGLIGGNSNYSMIANCAALGDVYATGKPLSSRLSSFVGGLAGQPVNLVQNCYAAGNVSLKNAIDVDTPYIGAIAGQTNRAAVTGCYFNSKATGTVNGSAVTLEAFGALINSGSNNISSHDTSSAVFTATMNNGLSKSGLESADAWLTSDDIGFTDAELASMRPDVWYEWVYSDGKTVLGSKAYEEQADPSDIFADGSGTEEDPWIIKTTDQLKDFADSFIKNNYAGKYIALGNDLTLTGDWRPIGHPGDRGMMPFEGHFDGRNYKISGMTIGTKDAPVEDTQYRMYYGLFADVANGGSIENLGIENAKVYVTSDVSVMAGLLTGFMESGAVINNCWATGEVGVRTTEGDFQYNSYAGGLVGYSQQAQILNCWTDADVDAYCRTANAQAGGIVGLTSFGSLVNCYALGNVSGETDRTVDDGGVAFLGGIAGCSAGKLVNCYFDGSITSKSWTQTAGALVGMATAISETYNNYYSEKINISVNGEVLDPAVAIGRQVPAGFNEYGDYMSGALVNDNTALSADDMAAEKLAARLNDNFNAFPVKSEDLDAALRQWTAADGKAVFGEGEAVITYKEVEKPTADIDYKDGVYYGRDNGKNVIVKVTVENKKVTKAEVVDPASFDEANAAAIIAAIIEDQKVVTSDSDTADDKLLKEAFSVALNKSLLGDTSTYEMADPSVIFAGGSGTAEDPYQIATAQQLRDFAAAINEEEHFNGDYIALTADIDLSGSQWMPAGSAGGNYFNGYFDGQGHKITGMQIGTEEAPADYTASGLFSSADGAVIKNLAVVDAKIYAERKDSTATYAGIIAGVLDDSTGGGVLVTNCAVSGEVNNKTAHQCYAAGIAGYITNGIILNCGADVNVKGASTGNFVYAGGIVGLDGHSIVANSYAFGSVYGDAGANSACVGGIAGMQGGMAGNNYTDVQLETKNTTQDIGGIAGRNTGIGVVNFGYFNSEKKMKSGNKELDAKAVGVNVTMFSSAVEKNTEGKTAAELKSEAFKDLLNDNQCEDTDLRSDMNNAIQSYQIYLRTGGSTISVDSWILDKIVRQENTPVIPEKSDEPVTPTPGGGGSGGSGSGGSGGSGSGGSGSGSSGGSGSGTTDNGNGTTTPGQPSSSGFTDVADNAYYKDAVDWAVSNNVTSGMSNTIFAPDRTCTRAQAVTFLWRAAGSPAPKNTATAFNDVAAGSYYHDAVLWAVEQGIVNGTSASAFTPDAECTRAQIVTMLWRMAGSPAQTGSSAFNDVSANAYYAQAVQWATANGVTSGTSATSFSPDNGCTRAQIVTFLYRHIAK